MKPLLFRVKIALWSLLLSGTLVVGFGIFFLGVIFDVGVDRVDRELRMLGEGALRSRHPVNAWAQESGPLAPLFNDVAPGRMAAKVWDQRGAVLFLSTNAPALFSNIPMRALGGAVYVADPPPEVSPPRRRGPSRPGRFVERLDRDGDGRVSVDEFDGPAEHFAEFDQDHDGYLGDGEVPGGPPRARPGSSFAPGMRPPEHLPVHEDGPPRVLRVVVGPAETISTPGGKWRICAMGNGAVTLVVGMDLADFYAEAHRFKKAFLVATPLALLLLAAGGWLLAVRAMRPVALVTETAKNITARDLARRVPAMTADAELGKLTDVINEMLDRLERSYNQAIRFSGDAAHELQTPLTVLQGELDNAVQASDPGSEEQQRYSQLLEEVQHLKTVTQKLLLLARADAGQLALQVKDVDLAVLLQDAMDDVEAIAPDRKIEQTVVGPVGIVADEELLLQVIRNMTSNAIKYGDPGGVMRFELATHAGMVLFTLGNNGAAIPPEDRPRLFDRFHRVDKSHSRKVGGSGLGLSLAREIARAHGGDLVLNDYAEGLVSFTLVIPLKQ